MNTSAKGTALITGASSGIGAVHADRLAGRGHDPILVTMPSLPDAGGWDAFTAARLALRPNLSHNHPADRYRPIDL